MQELYDFRILARNAPLLFQASEGKLLGDDVRKIVIDGRDPRFHKIGELNERLRKETGKPFYYSWDCRRVYSRAELQNAKAFRLIIKSSSVFEPAGECCGTKYDDATACPKCGAGALQTSPLILDFRRIPKKSDVVMTIANEWIVSEKFAILLIDHAASRFELAIVQRKAQRKAAHEESTLHEYIHNPMKEKIVENKNCQRWHQVIVKSPPLDMVSPTRFGNNPFDADISGKYRCPFGHIPGLNLLSEVFIRKQEWHGSDIALTKQYVGVRGGVVRPHQLIVISSRLRAIMMENNIQGVYFEVAHLV